MYLADDVAELALHRRLLAAASTSTAPVVDDEAATEELLSGLMLALGAFDCDDFEPSVARVQDFADGVRCKGSCWMCRFPT